MCQCKPVKWEYMDRHIVNATDDDWKVLNELGSEGWEMVSGVYNAKIFSFFFKRPVKE